MKKPLASILAPVLAPVVVAALLSAGIASSEADAARPAKKTTKPTKPAVTTPVKPEGAPVDPRGSDPRNTDSDTAGGGAVDAGARKGPARIEFDDRLVQGQTNKANAIYLFERRESALRSLLKKRTDFHDEIDEMLEDELVR